MYHYQASPGYSALIYKSNNVGSFIILTYGTSDHCPMDFVRLWIAIQLTHYRLQVKGTKIFTKIHTITLPALSAVPTLLEDTVYSDIQTLTNSTDDSCHTDFMWLWVDVQLTHVLQMRHGVGGSQLLTLAIVATLTLHLLHVKLQQRKGRLQVKMQQRKLRLDVKLQQRKLRLWFNL